MPSASTLQGKVAVTVQRKPCGGRARFALSCARLQPAQPLLPMVWMLLRAAKEKHHANRWRVL
jgi:hypothetical protein